MYNESGISNETKMIITAVIAVLCTAILVTLVFMVMPHNTVVTHEVTRVVTQIVTATPDPSTGNALIDALSSH